jgi:hypothetical protein
VLAYPVVSLLRAKRVWPVALLLAFSLSFVVNMAFVTLSRTALVTMPIMLAVFALLHLKWRSIVVSRGTAASRPKAQPRRSRPASFDQGSETATRIAKTSTVADQAAGFRHSRHSNAGTDSLATALTPCLRARD